MLGLSWMSNVLAVWFDLNLGNRLFPPPVEYYCFVIDSKCLIQSNLYLRTQLDKNGCTYCEKYLNRGMDSHRLTCEVVQLVNDLPKKMQKFDKPLELHVKGSNWSMTFPKKFQNFLKTKKQNVNWNQTFLNEVDLTVKWSWSHHFLFSQ
jgi:hypothetical protein